MRFRPGVTAKITLLVLGGTSLVFALVLTYSYVCSRETILANSEQNARNLTRAAANQIEQEFRSVAKIAGDLGCFLEHGRCDEPTLLRLIKTMVSENKELYGSAVAFEPFAFRPGEKSYAPYYFKTPKGVEFAQLGNDSYDYIRKDWYHLPKVLKEPVWTEPYFDEGAGNILMVTYSYPVREREKESDTDKLKAVVTADVDLQGLTDLVQSIPVGRTGYCFIVSSTGTFVTNPRRELVIGQSIFSRAEQLDDPALRRIGRAMLREKSGFVELGPKVTGTDSFLAFARIPSPGWALGAIFSKDEIFQELDALHRRTLLLATAGISLLLAVSLLVAGSIARPLRRMAAVTRRVAGGDLDVDLPDVRRSDEVGELARAFTQMASELKTYIKELTETTAAKQRIESELSIAAQIQRSMLPSTFPAFPDRDEFDIFAVMRPAKEVGGDFYDFFLLDDHRLCVVVGDVSGKGVPAALFMAVTKYLIEASAIEEKIPDEALRRVNDQLARHNDSCMFVTLFLGILNLDNGEFLYANGGHNPPLLLKPDDGAAFFERPGGPVLGIMDDAVFQMGQLRIQPGSVILIYSDGVTEAFNNRDEAFSDHRLRETVAPLRQKQVREITETLVDEIDSFCKGSPQTDDITVLSLRFNHPRQGPR